MNNILLFLMVCFGTVHEAVCQVKYDVAIQDAFKKYRKAYLEVDRATIIEMTHPNIIEMGGGRTFYLDELTDEYNVYNSTGIQIKDIIIKQPSKVIKSDKDLQAMVPYVRIMSKDDETLKEEHFFLVSSLDDGKSWYFTDMNKYDATSIKIFIPGYNERLNIYLNSIKH